MLWVLSCADQIFLLVFVSYLSSETQVSHLLENVKISIFAKFEDKISKSVAHLFVLSWCFENSLLFWDERPLTHSWSISLSQFHCHPWVKNKNGLKLEIQKLRSIVKFTRTTEIRKKKICLFFSMCEVLVVICRPQSEECEGWVNRKESIFPLVVQLCMSMCAPTRRVNKPTRE